MLTDIDTPSAGRPASGEFELGPAATPDDVFAALRRVLTRASGGSDLTTPVSAAPYADGLLHPRKTVPKTYVLKVKGVMSPEDLEVWRKGVRLEDGMTSTFRR